MTSNTRRYEYESSKFWEISINGCLTTVGYGAIGANPRLSKKKHKDIIVAKQFAEKMMKEKLKKGYVLVSTSEEEEDKKNVGDGANTKRKRKMTNNAEEEDDDNDVIEKEQEKKQKQLLNKKLKIEDSDVAEANNSSSKSFVWQYYMDVPMDGKEAGWHFYDENVSNGLEKEFGKGQTSWQIKSGYFKYEINIASMTQRNMTSGTTRSIRRWNKNDQKVINVQNVNKLTTRRYEYESSRFWEITINGCVTTVGYGAIGANPRLSEKKHKNVTVAEKFVEKMMKEKTKKGYVLVSTNTEKGNEKGQKEKKKTENDNEKKMDVDNENNNSLTKKQRYELGDPAHRFWEIQLDENSTFVSYGAIGSNPKKSNVEHNDSITAENFVKKKIKEKISKGYYKVPVVGDGGGDDDNDDSANIIVEKDDENNCESPLHTQNDVSSLSTFYGFGPSAFGPFAESEEVSTVDEVPNIVHSVVPMVEASVPNVQSMRGQRGEKKVLTMMRDTYNQGLFMHGSADSPVNRIIVPSIRYIFHVLKPLSSQDPKRVTALTTLAYACQDCQQVQAREIMRIHSDFTSQKLTFERQLKYSLIRQKESALHNLITTYHPNCDLDHTQIEPCQQRAHLWSAYIAIVGERLGLDGITAAKSDRFIRGAIRNVYAKHGIPMAEEQQQYYQHVSANSADHEFIGGVIIQQLTQSLSVKEWLKNLIADINNQSSGADRMIDRECIFQWVSDNMDKDFKYLVFYDDSRANEYHDLEPSKPTEENKYNPFLSPRVLVNMLVKAGMLQLL